MALNTVKVIFKDSKHNYSTSVSDKTTEETAKEYFVNGLFDVGVFPEENIQKCIGIEFNKPLKIEFLRLNSVSNSGQGKDATHLKVMRAFEESKENGINYCKKRGWEALIIDGILQIKSSALFGFQMNAIIKEY